MIDDESASGAEALTLCLKDNAEKIEDLNVTVVGQTTYGKGSAQQDYELSNGYSIHVTYAKWYSPNGTNIDKIGVDPTPTHNLDFIDYENYYFTYESLKFEDHNNKVLKLQYQLKYLGYEDIRVHGFFDEITEMAIKDIQTKKGLDVDGKLTLATFNIIKRAIVDEKLEQSEKEYNYVISLIGA